MTTMAIAQAKTNKKSTKNKTTIVNTTSHQAKAKKASTTAKTTKGKTVDLSNRKIYHWTKGQRSTPTGQDATSSNGSGYAAIKKDTAKVVKKGKH